MNSLIELGEQARPALERLIDDPKICNEVILILGAIGNESTVPLLIDRYPSADLMKNAEDDPILEKKVVCLTFALTYLTGIPIGRSREGVDYDPDNRRYWQSWWTRNREEFIIPKEKPSATWVPDYDASMTPNFRLLEDSH